jgi:hypothetical protein
VQEEYRHLVLTKNKNQNAYTRNYIRDPKLWFDAESTRKLQRTCSLAPYTYNPKHFGPKTVSFSVLRKFVVHYLSTFKPLWLHHKHISAPKLKGNHSTVKS